jgi:hypothetical protein
MEHNVEIIDLDKFNYEIGVNTTQKVGGIEYARYLRRNNKKHPIIFTSYDNIENILKRENSSIINAIGHNFMQLPKSDKDREKVISNTFELNEIQLADIKINYCGVRSALSSTFHEFKNYIKAIKNKELADKQKVIEIKKVVAKYRTILIKEYPDNSLLLSEYNRITGLFKKNDLATIDHLLVDDKSLANTIPTEEEDVSKELMQYSWEVLLLDDNLLEIEDVIKELKSRNLTVHKAKTVQQAKEIINSDVNNKITVAISDYRLYEDPSKEHKKMQPEQGYDFLIWLSQQNRFTARIALSGLSKQFLMDSFRKYSANVKVYSKTDFVHNGVNIFVDDVIEMGNYFEDVKNSIPTAANWKHLKPYYIAYKKLPNADSIENYITQKANEVIEAIKLQIELKTNRSKIDKWQQCRDYIIDCKVGDTQSNFDNNKYKDITDENLDSFYAKLINRRVIIYFLLYDIIDKEVLSWLLHNGVVSKEGNLPDAKSQQENKKQVFTNQSLKESDIPLNILLEEKQWLSSMGINVNGYKVELNNFHSLFESFFKSYGNPRIVKAYKDNFTDKKSIKHFKNNIDNFIKDILASEPKKEGLSFISSLENIVSRMGNYFPQNNDLDEMIKKINYATRR